MVSLAVELTCIPPIAVAFRRYQLFSIMRNGLPWQSGTSPPVSVGLDPRDFHKFSANRAGGRTLERYRRCSQGVLCQKSRPRWVVASGGSLCAVDKPVCA
jgi:hypothetical protein